MKEQRLMTIRNMGEKGVQEILFKTSVIFDYYDRHKKKEEKSSTEVELEMLKEELATVQAEIQRLDDRTDELLFKLQENLNNILKGGL